MGRVSIGGQAVIEGIMMKNNDKYAIAVRKPDKEIEVKVEQYKPARDRCSLLGFPIIRGVFNFVESLVIGIKTLMYSASFYDEEEEDKNKDKDKEKKKSKKEKKKDDKKGNDGLFMFTTVALSLIVAIGLFMLLPAYLASLLDRFISNNVLLGLVEGIIRIVIFLIYVVLISGMEDIKRTFMYHGAEHKCINCLEAGEELTVDNVMKHSRFHKRCGTSFLFIVMIVSILVFMCIRTDTLLLKLLYRVLLVPVVAGISYEFIKFAGSHDNLFANVLSKPGLWVQRLTTREPSEDMAEVAIVAVENVLDWRAYLDDNKRADK